MYDTEVLTKFVVDGIQLNMDKKFFKQLAFFPMIFPSIVVAIALFSVERISVLEIINIILLSIVAILSIITFVISFLPHTVKRYFIKASILFFNVSIGFGMLQFHFYNRLFGLNAGYLFFIIIPMISVLFFYDFFMKRASIDNKEKKHEVKKTTICKAALSVSAIVIAVRFFSNWMRCNLDQESELLIFNILCLMANCFLSIGLIFIPRLYFVCKLENKGVDLSQFDPFGKADRE